ncbi:MAG: 6-phosphofructokinase [Phycisphaerae bacterium]|nr:6-phosphofructokinase [Phycisphaerae bacterium]
MAALKGNAVVGQAGGPTAVINQSLVGVIQEVQKYDHITHLLGARHGVKGIMEEDYIDLKRQPTEMLELVAYTPASALGSTRHKPKGEDFERILGSFKQHDVRYFFYIGGNDSAAAAQIINKLAQEAKYDLRVIHIPKTIDNDLLVTDHCPGYGSAAKFVASAFIGDNLDNRALPGVKINILMGRDAGFITAAAILARQREDDGPHLVYIPERPFCVKKFIEAVGSTVDRIGRCLIAVSEGIRDEKGVLWTKRVVDEMEGGRGKVETDSFGNLQLSGTGSLADYLAGVVRSELGKRKSSLRVRADTYGYLQRSFPSWSEVDAWEARLCGQMAVSYSLEADQDGSVALVRLPGTSYACGTQLVPLESVAPSCEPKTKRLPDEYIVPAGNYIRDQFLVYAGPLVGNLPKVGWFEQVKTSHPYGGLA